MRWLVAGRSPWTQPLTRKQVSYDVRDFRVEVQRCSSGCPLASGPEDMSVQKPTSNARSPRFER